LHAGKGEGKTADGTENGKRPLSGDRDLKRRGVQWGVAGANFPGLPEKNGVGGGGIGKPGRWP